MLATVSTSSEEFTSVYENNTGWTTVSLPRLSTESNTILTLSLMIAIVGVIMNTLVIIVIATTKSLRRLYTNIFLVNQSCIDFLASLVTLLYYVLPTPIYYNTFLSQFLCKFWGSQLLLWGSTSASTFNLLALTLERLADLRDPFNHRLKFTRKHLYITLTVPWILGISYQAAYCVPTSFVFEGNCYLYEAWKSPEWQQAATFISIAIDYVIPAIMVLVAYIVILGILSKQLTDDIGGQNMAREEVFKRGMRNTTKMLLVVSACFLIFSTPSRVLFFLYSLNLNLEISNDIYHFGTIWSMINAICNPFIYVFQYRSFRRAVLKTLCCCLPQTLSDSYATTESRTKTQEQ